MKHISSLLLAGFFILTTCVTAHATGYLGPTITEYDLVGCKTHPNDPRCHNIIQVACNSICVGHTQEKSDFGNACKNMCPKLTLREESDENKSENQPKTRLQ